MYASHSCNDCCSSSFTPPRLPLADAGGAAADDASFDVDAAADDELLLLLVPTDAIASTLTTFKGSREEMEKLDALFCLPRIMTRKVMRIGDRRRSTGCGRVFALACSICFHKRE